MKRLPCAVLNAGCDAAEKPVDLVLLHANDLRGGFLPRMKNGIRAGGLARPAGCIAGVRRENPNTV